MIVDSVGGNLSHGNFIRLMYYVDDGQKWILG